MTPLSRLQELFMRFPGIGPRQAKRFVYYLLRQPQSYRDELAALVTALKDNVRVCEESCAYFYTTNKDETLSPIARDSDRDRSTVLVVERDADLESVEATNAYKGTYFVLGGIVPSMEEDIDKHIRTRELRVNIEKRAKEENLQEIIIATRITPDGDYTAEKVQDTLSSLQKKYNFQITLLGRGLSTGTELQYIDRDTFENALVNRKA